MRNVRAILRLHPEHQLAGRQIAQSLGLSHSTVRGVVHRAAALGLAWPLLLDDATLEGKLYPPTAGQTAGRVERAWETIYRELRRKGGTLRQLWHEYRRDYPDGYQDGRCSSRRRSRTFTDAGEGFLLVDESALLSYT
ncbi:MAG TPA: hypothetical protein VJT32_16845 [bacterium]|nr:hypothetical protein [bacterium]